jgi:D-inositol-3-phosphate glycosyltransferase
MLRVAIVGPVEPFRSGVARHTTALARALARRPLTAVRVFSFSRQYPSLLFPGASDRAEDGRAPRDLEVRYALDSLHPLSWHAVARDLAAFRPDLVVTPAWTFFLAPCLSYVMHQLRRRGIPVVAIVHNVADHESSALRAWLSAVQLRRASAYVTHTRQLATAIQKLVPGARVEVCVHPVFDYPRAAGTLPKRAELELLMFGLLRPYKGLDLLLEALARLNSRSIRLSVVGEPWQDAAEILASIDRLGLRERVELVPRHVSDAEAAEYFERADAVVLPYRSVTGSGVLPLAYHYGKPVVVSRLPGFLELVEEGRTGWTVPVGEVEPLARVLGGQVTRAAALAMSQHIERVRRDWSFERFAEVVLAAGLGVAMRDPDALLRG